MKYLINESQINKLIFNYLDGKDYYLVHEKGNYEFFESKESWEMDEYPVIFYDKKYRHCNISSNLVEEMSDFFSLEFHECLDIISAWMGNKLNVKIVDSFSISDD